nr:DUF5011 domain-containing protein [Candidatus Gracilibacteria bacterium]
MKTSFTDNLRKSTSIVLLILLTFQLLSPWNNIVFGIGEAFYTTEVQANVSAGINDQSNTSYTLMPNETAGVDNTQANISATPTPNIVGNSAAGETSFADGSYVTSTNIGSSYNGTTITITDDNTTDCSTLTDLGGSAPNYTITCDLDNSLTTGTPLTAGLMTTLIDGNTNFSASLKGGAGNTVLPDIITLTGGIDSQAQVSTVTPANVEVGDVFTVTINGTEITFTGTEASVANITAGLTSTINTSTEAVNVSAFDNSTDIQITANNPGTSFTINSSAINKPAVAQVSTVTPANVEVGDVFTVIINGTEITFTGTEASVANITAGLTSAINTSTEAVNVSAIDNSTDIQITANNPGTSFTISSSATNKPAVAQIVNFTPTSLIYDHRVYRATIDGINFNFATNGGTVVQDILTGLQPSMNSGAVTCSEDSIKITCTANVAGTPFTYDSTIIDKSSLYITINSEFIDGATRSTYILTQSDYTTTSWDAYIGSINTAIAVESDLNATTTEISNAITDIDTKKQELQLSIFTNSYTITNNSTNDSNIDTSVYSGSVFSAYQRDGNIYFKQGIGSEELIGSGSSPTIEVYSNIPHIVYFDGGIIKYINKSSGSWSSPLDITAIVNPTSADFKIDSSGFIHLVYSKASTENYDDLYYSTNTSGSFVENNFCHGYYWTGFGGSYCGHPVGIQLDSNNYFYISYVSGWRDSTPSYSTQSMALYTNNPTGNSGSSGYNWNTSAVTTVKNNISLDNSGNIYIAYGAGGNRYLGKVTSGVWSDISMGTSFGSYSVSSDGSTIGYSYTDGSGDLRYKENKGGGFIGSTLIESGSSNSSLSMNNSERYIYYIKNDGSDDEIKIASTKSIYSVPGQIDNTTNTFVSSQSGSIGLSNLEVGGVYMLMSGSTMVSSGILVATNTTGNLSLNPLYYNNYGKYTLTLSGTFNAITTSNIDSETLYIGPFDYQDLYVNQISTALSGNGINNNLGDVTYANVQSFSGLYFEEPSLGKIYFSNSLDLTNSGTIAFLQDLPNKLNISNGNIDFDPTNSDFANYGAQLYMYFNTGSTFITSISNPESFVVKTSTGQLLDSSGILSNIHGACGVGDLYCTLVFDTAHFTTFDLKPLLTDVSIVSNNAYSGSLAKYSDKILLNFTGSEALTGIYVTFNGIPAGVINGGGNTWLATSQNLTSGSGVVSFSIDYYDLTGNPGVTVTGTTDLSSVSIDPIPPSASVDYSITIPTAQDVVATLTGVSEEIVITNNSGLDTYTFTDNGSFTFQYRDLAGNTGSTTATVNNINHSIPTIILSGSGTINIEKGTSYTELGATWSDQTDGTGVVSTISGSINTNILGTYLLDYTYVNSLGLTGSTTRTVNVIDTTAPSIPTILNPDSIGSISNVQITGTGDINEFIKIYNSSGSVVGSGTITSTGSFDINVNLVEGRNTLTAKSYDSSGNYSGNSNSVTIIKDTTTPVINLKEIKNTESSQVILEFNFTEDNLLNESGSVEVYDGLGFTGTYNISFSGNIGESTLAGLANNTNYQYTLYLTDDAGNTTTSTGSFSTSLQIWTGSDITETGSVAFGFEVGLGEGNTFDLQGTNIYLSSDLNDSDSLSGTLTLSGVNIIVSSGTWNGVLIPPMLIDPLSNNAATGSEIGSGVTIVQTIKTGSETSGLSSTGGYFNVSFAIPGYSSGTTFKLYRSSDGNNWVLNTPDPSCILDSNLICSFRTDHLSFFAPGFDSTPDSFSFTSLTDKELNTLYESNTITVTGTNTGSTISIVGGEYKIGTGTYTSSTGIVNNGETVTVRLTSSNSYSTLKTATLTIGGVSANFNVTTKQSTGGGNGGSSSGGGASGNVCILSELECREYANGVYKLFRKDGVTCDGGDLGKVCTIGLNEEPVVLSPNKGLSKYFSNNPKINEIALKIDKLIEQKGKQDNQKVIELRNQLIQDIEKYLEALKSGNKTDINNAKKNLLDTYKKLLDELKNKMYEAKNGEIIKFAKGLDEAISNKIQNENSIIWQYRNELIELLDNYYQNRNRLTIQEKLNLRTQIQEAFKKLLDELKMN